MHRPSQYREKRRRGETDRNGTPPLSLPAIPQVLHLKEIQRSTRSAHTLIHELVSRAIISHNAMQRSRKVDCRFLQAMTNWVYYNCLHAGYDFTA